MHVVYVSGEHVFSFLQNDEASVTIKHLKTLLFVCGLFKHTILNTKQSLQPNIQLIRGKFKKILCLSVSIQLWSIVMMFLILLRVLFQ